MRRNIIEIYMKKIDSFPLWVKQRIYYELQKNLKNNNCLKFVNDENIDLANYTPILTFKGSSELSDKSGGYDTNIYNFLTCCKNNYTISEISLNTFLTMEEICKLFEFCVEQNLVKKPSAKGIIALSGYMSGKFRIGEYFNRLGILNDDALENTVLQYDKMRSLNNDIKFGEVLKKLKLVDKNDIDTILKLKTEATERFILDISEIPAIAKASLNNNEIYTKEMNNLKEENSKLKTKLVQLLALVKKSVK